MKAAVALEEGARTMRSVLVVSKSVHGSSPTVSPHRAACVFLVLAI